MLLRFIIDLSFLSLIDLSFFLLFIIVNHLYFIIHDLSFIIDLSFFLRGKIFYNRFVLRYTTLLRFIIDLSFRQ